MTALPRNVTFDCADPWTLSAFWQEVTGYERHEESRAADDEILLVAPEGAGPGLLFIRVPERKSVKNRVHLDLQPASGRDEEVARLTGLGATVAGDFRRPDGTGWVVLTDPEGNEFCVERSAEERAATERAAASQTAAQRTAAAEAGEQRAAELRGGAPHGEEQAVGLEEPTAEPPVTQGGPAAGA